MTTLARRLRALALVLAAALGLALVPATAAHASGPGSATFTVTAEGTPVADQWFVASGPDFGFSQSDANGVVSFSDLALGDYTFNASLDGYQPQEVAFTLSEESPTWEQSVDLQPWPTGTGIIEVTLVDQATGDPIPDVELFLNRTDAPGPSAHGVTDSGGRVDFTSLVAGDYGVAVVFAPGYFTGSAQVTLADGATVQAEVALLAADAQIEGRVVDEEGNGVADVWVAAFSPVVSTNSSVTDADGYYVITGAGEGTWEVIVSPDEFWERAVVTVTVAAGSTAVAPDLVLVPRFTGTIAGQVGTTDGIPESQIGGVFDICVTVLTPAGEPVPGATTVTGGDSFYFFWLAPGDYTVRFEDCDPDRDPHRYRTTYLGGGTTLEGATIVTVETLVDLWLDKTLLAPEQANPAPEQPAVPVGQNALKKAFEGLVDAPSGASRGDTVEIQVGEEYAGQWVSVWLFPGATQFGGWHQVAADGTIEVTVPASAPPGKRKLAVQSADDVLIGWTKFKVSHH